MLVHCVLDTSNNECYFSAQEKKLSYGLRKSSPNSSQDRMEQKVEEIMKTQLETEYEFYNYIRKRLMQQAQRENIIQ